MLQHNDEKAPPWILPDDSKFELSINNKNARRRQMLTAGHYIILTDQAEPVFPYREIPLRI